MQPLRVESFLTQPFAENCYLVIDSDRGECFIVDPGFEPELLLDRITDLNLSVIAILNTHGHADHIAGNRAMKDHFPNTPLIIGAGDAPMLSDPELNLSRGFGLDVTSPPADRTLRAGEKLDLLGRDWEVREI